MALLPGDPKDQKLLMASLLALALVLAYHRFVRAPRAAETEALRTHLTALETGNTTARAIADQQGGPALLARVDELERHKDLLEALVPRKEEVPLLLREISLRARDTRLQLTRLKPETEEAGEHYVKRTYELSVQGSYHSIGTFLSQVGSLSRIMTPVQLKLMPDGVKRLRDGGPVVNANFRLLTYIVPPNGESPDAHVSPSVVGAVERIEAAQAGSATATEAEAVGAPADTAVAVSTAPSATVPGPGAAPTAEPDSTAHPAAGSGLPRLPRP